MTEQPKDMKDWFKPCSKPWLSLIRIDYERWWSGDATTSAASLLIIISVTRDNYQSRICTDTDGIWLVRSMTDGCDCQNKLTPHSAEQVCWAARSERSGSSWGGRWRFSPTCGWRRRSKPWRSSTPGWSQLLCRVVFAGSPTVVT